MGSPEEKTKGDQKYKLQQDKSIPKVFKRLKESQKLIKSCKKMQRRKRMRRRSEAAQRHYASKAQRPALRPPPRRGAPAATPALAAYAAAAGAASPRPGSALSRHTHTHTRANEINTRLLAARGA